MIALVRTELLKVRTTRMALWLLLATVVLVALGAVATLLTAGGQAGGPALDTGEGIRGLYSAAAGGNGLALVLGIIGMSGEYRHGTMTSTFLATPRRGRVVAAKLAAFTLVGSVIGLAAILATLAVAVPGLAWKDVPLSITQNGVPRILLGAVLVTAGYGLLGVGVGALLRNQVAAILVALIWTFIAESLIVALLPAVGKWLPGGAVASILDVSVSEGPVRDLLPLWAGLLLFAAYGVLFAMAAQATTTRRDIT